MLSDSLCAEITHNLHTLDHKHDFYYNCKYKQLNKYWTAQNTDVCFQHISELWRSNENHEAGSRLTRVNHHGNLWWAANLLRAGIQDTITDQSDHWKIRDIVLQDPDRDKSKITKK